MSQTSSNTPRKKKKNGKSAQSDVLEHHGLSSRLTSLASSAGETVRHIPEKATKVQTSIGSSLQGVSDKAEKLQQQFLELFPSFNGSSLQNREQVEAGLSRLRLLARLMDDLVEIPVINARIGIDPFISKIPGLGTVFPLGVSVYSLVEATRTGAPPELLLKMMGRHVVNFLGKKLPVVGTMFDAYYKAHRRNVNELIAWTEGHLDSLGSSKKKKTGGSGLITEPS